MFKNRIKYLSWILLGSTLIAPSSFARLNVEEETKAYEKLARRAAELSQQQREEIASQKRQALNPINKEIETLEKEKNTAIAEIEEERSKKLEKADKKQEALKQKYESALEEIDNELKISLQPHQNNIEKLIPKVKERIQPYEKAIKQICKIKTDTLNGPYAKFWDGYNSMDLGLKISAQEAKIKQIEEEMLGGDRKAMQEIEETHYKKYKHTLSLLRDMYGEKKRRADKKHRKIIKDSNSQLQKIIDEFNEKAKPLYTRLRDIRAPYIRQMDEILLQTELKLIEQQ